MSDQPKITGGCLCGAVRYQADEPLQSPDSSYYCHCRMCQKLSGSAFVIGIKVRKTSFSITFGEVKFYKSSIIAERGFCANCGSRLIYRPSKTDWLGIDTGTLDHPELALPKYHTGIENQLPWLTIQDELPRMRTDDNPRIVALRLATGHDDADDGGVRNE